MTECFGIADVECGRWAGAKKTGHSETRQDEGNEFKGMFHRPRVRSHEDEVKNVPGGRNNDYLSRFTLHRVLGGRTSGTAGAHPAVDSVIERAAPGLGMARTKTGERSRPA